jgi:hypothetical protein
VEAAGKDVTTDKVIAALRATSITHPIFYDTKSFKNNQASPESVKVEQIKGGQWTAVSPLLNDK